MNDLGIKRVEPLFVNRGQSAYDDERRAVMEISRMVGADKLCENVITMPWYARQKELNPCAFPYGRNLVLGAVAVSYASVAFHTCSSLIVMGFTKDDSEIVADSSPEFVSSLNDVIRECIESNDDNSRIKFIAPLISITKGQAIKWLMTQSVGEAMVRASWSCYENSAKHGGLHCGTCGACVRRHEAFLSAGICDPTEYHSKNGGPNRVVSPDSI